MSYDIVLGRLESDKKLFGKKGSIFIGKSYVKMGQTTSLSNRMFLDIARTHVISVVGKRGSGKSYSLSVIAEEMARLPPEINERLSMLFFDTMGIFWTMKFPNTREKKLLEEWEIEPEGLDIEIYTPKGYYKDYKDRGIPTDHELALKTSELDSGDWINVFELKPNEESAVLIQKIIEQLKEQRKNYDIEDIIAGIRSATKATQIAKDAAENRFVIANKWGLFDREGTEIKDFIKPGKICVLDISCYTSVAGAWSIKALVIGIITRKLLVERIVERKYEEYADIQSKSTILDKEREEKPLVWVFIDEAHEFLPKTGSTPATDALVQLLREGRQPGISLVLATQQPGEIHKDVLTQSDIIIAHRVTAKPDIDALNNMMQSYLTADIQRYLNELPDLKGSAIILDDNSERIYPVRIHPKRSWHGGEAPSAIKVEKKLLDF